MKPSPDDMAVAEALADLTLKVATPIAWHDRKEGWPRRIFGGTCFFLRFATGIIGITANHVVEALEQAVADNPNTVCRIRTSKPVDLPCLIIDRCAEWDIATFRASEELAKASGSAILDCTGDQPPPETSFGPHCDVLWFS